MKTLLGLLVFLVALPFPVEAQIVPPGEGCQLCHGEVELLRQHVPSLARARSLVATREQIQASAHTGMSCGECHSGFDRFPHGDRGATESCASCHQETAEPWSEGVHADPDPDGISQAECSTCHGVHDVLPADAMARAPGVEVTNARCVSCHDARSLPPGDPHADTVACVSCHAPHATRTVDDPASLVAPHAQGETCGGCHEEVGPAFSEDVHGQALAELGRLGAAELALRGEAPPGCTSCHGGHDMVAPSQDRFNQEMVEACAACHGDYANTYFGTYHGKATALGSEIAATCDQCHGSHGIYPASDSRSLVSQANLVETCGSCHEHARPAFVEYDSHPNPLDPERNAPLHYSFVFMNTILVGVLVVFGLHTLLWWVRLKLDKRRGIEHGIGVDHE